MNGISDLLQLKQIAFFNKNNEDLVISLESNREELFFGTSKGKIIRFKLKNHELVTPASLALPVHPIKQLSILPNDNLLLAVHDKSLVHILRNSLIPVASTGQGTIELISINRRVKSSEIILFALATNKKQILICKAVPTDKGLNLEIIEKISTSSNVTNLCFDGKSICYSTSTKYYILDMTAQPRVHHELISLNEGSSPHIVCIGQDEFAICASEGLIIFVKMDGTSTRPPLDLNLKVEDMLFVSPILFVIGTEKLMAFNIHDESLKMSLQSNNLHLLTHCANKLLLVTNEKRVFELVLIDTFGEKIKDALKQNIDDGLQLIQALNSIFPNDIETINVCNEILLEECLNLLNNSNFDGGLELFLQTNFDPTQILSRIAKINVLESNSWEIELSVVESFLEKLLHDERFLDYSKTVQSYLIRVKTLLNSLDFNDVDECLINDEDLKEWLLANNYHVLLAEFYFEYGHIEEAMKIWKLYVDKEGMKQEDLEPLTNRLIALTNNSNENNKILKDMLTFLAPKMPEMSMNVVQQMLNVDLDWLCEIFHSNSTLLLDYLEKHEEDYRNLEDIEDVIRKLAVEDLDAAEILYIKFSDQRPHLIKFLIPEYIKREDKSGNTQRKLVNLLCIIRPFNGIEKIISELPPSYLTRDTILLFQNTVKKYDQCRSNLCLRLAIDKLIKENEAENQAKQQFTSIRCESGDRCNLCNQRLASENISFLHNKAVHSRCLRKT